MHSSKFGQLVAANDNLAGRYRGYIHAEDANKYELEDETFVVVVHNCKSTTHCSLLAMKNGWTYHLNSCQGPTVPGAITVPFQLQHPMTSVCAIYVLYFASGLFNDETLENMLSVFDYFNQWSNDVCMVAWFREFVDDDLGSWFWTLY